MKGLKNLFVKFRQEFIGLNATSNSSPPDPVAQVEQTLPQLTREQKILKFVDQEGYGVEIGPSYNPIAPKRAGYKVHVIDHANREDLVSKYTALQMPVDKIEDVDFIWQGQPYVELTGRPNFYDWIIASHVIEHSPDFIGFLDNCGSILKESGVLSLVVPDMRLCFDHFRPVTSIARVVEAHLEKRSRHTPGTALEHIMSIVRKNGLGCWDASYQGEYTLVHPPCDALDIFQQALNQTSYLDCHSWIFTPSSFRLLLQDLFALGLTTFREVAFFPSAGCEFYITLCRQGPPPGFDRMEMLKQIRSELLAMN
jgi:hypothetical protein